MEQVRLGGSELVVSRLALGCMSFGDPVSGFNEWSLHGDAADTVFRKALDLGITFWDTANVYGFGTSEEIVGRAIRTLTTRSEIVLATKVFFPMHDGPGGSGLSRAAILEQVDASLERLGTDYIDLYQIHRFDSTVPVEETMETLDSLVRSGKVRYLGACSMHSWQLAKLQNVAERNGWARFISMQHQYSLMQRHAERELLGLLQDTGIAGLPWSPLGRGRLARPWGTTTKRSASDRGATDSFDERHRPVAEAVDHVAKERGVPMATIALAWLLGRPTVAAPIVGATKPQHLEIAAKSLDFTLDPDECALLEGAYPPVEAAPFQ